MTALICSSCGLALSNKQGPTPNIGGFYWLETSDYRTRICLCVSCSAHPDPNSKLIMQMLPKSERGKDITFTHDQGLNEFIVALTGYKCGECLEDLGDVEKVYRDGWKLYHPKCRGQFDALYKKGGGPKKYRPQKDGLQTKSKGSA